MIDVAWKHFLIRERNAKNNIDPDVDHFQPGMAP